MEAKQIHPQLQTLQVRQEVPGSAQLFDKYLISVHCFNQTASVVYSSEAFFRDRNLSLMTWWCTISTLHRSKVFPLTRTTATLQQSCAKKLTNLSRKPSYPLLSCLFFISVDPILFSMHDSNKVVNSNLSLFYDPKIFSQILLNPSKIIIEYSKYPQLLLTYHQEWKLNSIILL